VVIEVHKSQNNDALWYRVGDRAVNVDVTTIEWRGGGATKFHDRAKNPSVAVFDVSYICCCYMCAILKQYLL
jgi:hypothetical protein